MQSLPAAKGPGRPDELVYDQYKKDFFGARMCKQSSCCYIKIKCTLNSQQRKGFGHIKLSVKRLKISSTD